jgi:tetratricopeptide (TPR) repeat protein
MTLGRDAEALRALERARATRLALIKDNPSLTRNHEQLSWVLSQAATIHRRAGRLADAQKALAEAQQAAERLAAEHPDNRDYLFDLADLYLDQGLLAAAAGRAAEAPSWVVKALRLIRPVAEASPPGSKHRQSLADRLRRAGAVLAAGGRPGEAVAALRESVAFFAGLASPTAGDLYTLACIQSLLSGMAGHADSGLTAEQARAAADAAIAALRRAWAAGWTNVAWMRRDTDLDPIRSRADYRLLLMDMDFPAAPFATLE